MRVGIYSHSATSPTLEALGAGFVRAGHRVDTMNAEYYDRPAAYDLVAVLGMWNCAPIVRDYRARGTPVLVVELGYLRRAAREQAADDGGYHQVSLNALNAPPAFACPPDRFDALNLEIIESPPKDGYVLICGQVPDDKSHGMTRAECQAWTAGWLAKYPNAVFRPHPLRGYKLPEGTRIDTHKYIEESLAGARLVVTVNSTAGNAALLAGVPVIADGQATYSDLSGEALPSLADRLAYFHRLAYGQWTREEMRDGACVEFLIEHLLPNVGFPASSPAELEPAKAAPKRRGRKPRRSSLT
ncbi:hypothetical protein [Castellaniella sp.]|uniref:hypothetical protein n=1 Tax=Castellaniella sp. TaxID=1955812 RepID=UPI00356110F2